MSDEALNAHLDWLDKCAGEQSVDHETWLELRVTQLEAELKFEKQLAIAHQNNIAHTKAALSIAMSENQRLTKYVENYEAENAALKRLLGEWREIVGETARLSWASDLITKTDTLLTAEENNPYGLIDWRKPVEEQEDVQVGNR